MTKCVSPKDAGISHINMTPLNYTNWPVLEKHYTQVQTNCPELCAFCFASYFVA